MTDFWLGGDLSDGSLARGTLSDGSLARGGCSNNRAFISVVTKRQFIQSFCLPRENQGLEY